MLNFESVKSSRENVDRSPVSRLILLLEKLGIKVLFDQKFDYDFAGECSYSDSVIKIGRIPSEQVLLTLCHEAGHLISHLRLQHFGLKFTTFEREFLAYLYGWTVIKWLKITEIDKTSWRAFHEKELTAYIKFKERNEKS